MNRHEGFIELEKKNKVRKLIKFLDDLK